MTGLAVRETVTLAGCRLPAGITEREGIDIGTPGTLPAPVVKV